MLFPGMHLDENGRALRCPLCDSDAQDSIEPFNSYDMARCRDCSLVYTVQRRIPPEQYEEVYSGEADYLEMVRVAEKTASGDWGFRQLRWFKRKAIRWIEAERPGSRLVDIGTGPGTFLLVAKQRGFSVKGVEPTKLAAEKARSLGVEMFNGMIQDFAASQDEKFDVVTSFEVIEHVPDFMSMLTSIRSILKPSGIFVFSVPNLDDPYCLRQTLPVNIPPLHINFFRRQSMRTALEKTGFALDRFATRPIPAASVRNEWGLPGLIWRAPMLGLLSLVGKSDGNTLLGMARPRA